MGDCAVNYINPQMTFMKDKSTGRLWGLDLTEIFASNILFWRDYETEAEERRTRLGLLAIKVEITSFFCTLLLSFCKCSL